MQTITSLSSPPVAPSPRPRQAASHPTLGQEAIALAWSLASSWEPVRRGMPGMAARALAPAERAGLEARPVVALRFKPVAGVPVVFFNDRETLWPGELSGSFRVITRNVDSPLKPAAGGFRLAASHSNASRKPAVLGARFTNSGSAPMTLVLSKPVTSATFGRLATRDVLAEALDRLPGASRLPDGRYSLSLAPGAALELPIMRLAANWWPLPVWPPLQWGAYELGISVASGRPADLAVDELGRFERTPAGPTRDPWEGMAAADPLAAHKRQRHQQGVFVPVAAREVALGVGQRATIAGYDFGPSPAGHATAYHVDHTAVLAIAGDPVLRFRGNGGFTNPMLGGKRWGAPGLDADHVLDVPLHEAIRQGIVTPLGGDRYRLVVRFNDNDNANLEVSLG